MATPPKMMTAMVMSWVNAINPPEKYASLL